MIILTIEIDDDISIPHKITYKDKRIYCVGELSIVYLIREALNDRLEKLHSKKGENDAEITV